MHHRKDVYVIRVAEPPNGDIMRIHVGCQLTFEFPRTTPMIAMLNVHFSRVSDLERPDHLMTNPAVPIEGYRDSFGNWCSRLVAPAGRFSLGANAIVRDLVHQFREIDHMRRIYFCRHGF